MVFIDFVAASIELNSLTAQQKLYAPHQIILADVHSVDTPFRQTAGPNFKNQKAMLSFNDVANAIRKNGKTRCLV